MPTFSSAYDIALWLDNPNPCWALSTFYTNPEIESDEDQRTFRQPFLKQLSEVAEGIRTSELILMWKGKNIGWNAENISRCIKGFKGVPADEPAVQEVFKQLAKKIKDSRNPVDRSKRPLVNTRSLLDGQQISSALNGMQSMNAENSAVRSILYELSKDANLSTCVWDAQAIGNALYGLQNMSSVHGAVQAILKSLAKKINESSAVLTSQHIGMSLYGLNHMNTDHPGVEDILYALANKINKSVDLFDSQSIGNTLYGMRNMNSAHPAVKAILKAIAIKINESKVVLNAQNIGMSLHGIRNMNPKDSEVQAVLLAIEKRFPKPFITESADHLSWAQAASGYIELAKKSPGRVMSAERVKILFPNIRETTISVPVDKVIELFVDKLAESHLNKDGVLNLHGLDYCSVGILLENVVKQGEPLPKKIVSGAGIHSKVHYSQVMRNLVATHLEKAGITGTWSKNGGAIKIIQPLPGTWVGRARSLRSARSLPNGSSSWSAISSAAPSPAPSGSSSARSTSRAEEPPRGITNLVALPRPIKVR